MTSQLKLQHVLLAKMASILITYSAPPVTKLYLIVPFARLVTFRMLTQHVRNARLSTFSIYKKYALHAIRSLQIVLSAANKQLLLVTTVALSFISIKIHALPAHQLMLTATLVPFKSNQYAKSV